MCSIIANTWSCRRHLLDICVKIHTSAHFVLLLLYVKVIPLTCHVKVALNYVYMYKYILCVTPWKWTYPNKYNCILCLFFVVHFEYKTTESSSRLTQVHANRLFKCYKGVCFHNAGRWFKIEMQVLKFMGPCQKP